MRDGGGESRRPTGSDGSRREPTREPDAGESSEDSAGRAALVPSRFVRLSNLVRPLTASRLEAWVRSLAGPASIGAPAGPDGAERWMWIHPLKTEAVVALATVDAADLVRQAADGAKFPAGRVDGGVVVASFSDISPEAAGAESEAERSKARAAVASRVEHLPMPANPAAAPEPASPAEPQPSAEPLAATATSPVPGKEPQRDVVQVVQHSTGFAPPLPHAASMAGKCPDELFRRTEAVPPLYWSPVPGHVAKRAKERAASQLQPSSRRSGPDDE